MPTSNVATAQLGGVALVIGATLNFTRMIPLVASDGFSFEKLPPANLEEAVIAATLRGWHASHIMALASIPLLIFGLIAAYQRFRTEASAPLLLAGVVGMSVGLASYGIAAVVDGLALPDAVRGYEEATGAEQEAAGVLAFHTHEFAGNFGGFGFAALLVSLGLFALGVREATDRRWFGFVGAAISAVASAGYLTSQLAVDLGDGLVVVLLMVGGAFVLMMTCGVWMVRRQFGGTAATLANG